MTVNEAAEALGVQPITVRKAIERGRMRASKRGPMWWVTPAAVEAYRVTSLGHRGPHQPAVGPRASRGTSGTGATG